MTVFKKKYSATFWRDTRDGYIFIAPMVLGLLIFTIGPMIASFFLSFTDYSLLRQPNWVGLTNYRNMFFNDDLFWKSLKVTVSFAIMQIPLGITCALLLALLLNQKVKGIPFFRTCFYMPAIVPAVASAVLWGWLLNPDWGLINSILKSLHLPTSRFLTEPESALPSLVLMSLWGIGAGMIIYLAALQGISESLYEAAKIDGANNVQIFFLITLPLITPTIFFNLVIALIATFQFFCTRLYPYKWRTFVLNLFL